jgi:HAD superfamily hydrolase (TIGR01549 family)
MGLPTDSPIKAVIFDLDDTLFDRKAAQVKILGNFRSKYAELFEDIEDSMVATAFFEADRLADEHFQAGGDPRYLRLNRFKFFLNMLSIEEDYAEEMTSYYNDLYSRADSEMPGAKDIVNKLDGKYSLGVITNGATDTQYLKLENLGLRGKFAAILISEEAGMQKPEPQIFWKAAEKLSCPPKECLFVGNSFNGDVVGAKNADMRACWFNPNGSIVLNKTIRPDYEIRNLTELFDILK